jgi:collagenase-like PrtC family protease
MTHLNKRPSLTLGPVFYHWPAEKMRDFYFRIADEAPVDCVYLGEVVCSKREILFDPYRDQVRQRLLGAGKQVIISSLALMTLPRELCSLEKAAQGDLMIEANDVAAIQVLKGKPFVVGPFINVLNEGTMDALIRRGAVRVVLASELSGQAISLLAAYQPAVEKEVQVFGRQPLAMSMRCYHARANGRDKDSCRFACKEDGDGMTVTTIDGQQLFAVNGTQTLTYGYLLLLDEMKVMADQGVTHFRLSPQNHDMVFIARVFRDFLDGRIDTDSTFSALINNKFPCFVNGFYHGREGMAFVPRT